jgi:hypothetical protein
MSREEQDQDVKEFCGLPMRWNRRKAFENLWNREDDRVFPPKQFGIGWDLNFHALCVRIRLFKKGKS